MSQKKNGMISNLSQTLLQCELFGSLTKEEIKPIFSLCAIEDFQAGEMIFCQGDEGTSIYIIKDGQVTLERSVDLGELKAQVSIAVLGAGRALGSWLSLLGESHSLMSSALCNRQTEVISLDGTRLRKILENNPPVGFKVMERLAFMLRDRIRGVYGALEKL